MQAQCAGGCVGGGWLIGNAAYFGPHQSWPALVPSQARTVFAHFSHFLAAPTEQPLYPTAIKL